MTDIEFWATIVAMGAVTFGARLLPILLLERLKLPDAVRRALRYVPVAVLSAIILPEMLIPAPDYVFDLSPGNVRLAAGVAAMLVAWRTKNVLSTIGVGMAVLWILQAAVR